MKILMLAPEPFLEPRGTPFSVYYRIKALISCGYEVDLITYPLGKEVILPGLNVYRAPLFPFMREIKVGPSLAKVLLDVFVFLIAFWRLCVTRYGYVHTHEEAGVIGVVLARMFGCKHLYDMHSDMAEEMSNFSFTRSRWLIHCVETLQAWVVRSSEAVIVVYPELEQKVRNIAPDMAVHLITNAPVDIDLPPVDQERIARLRQQLGLGKRPVLVYTGTLENYQGIDLLLQSVVQVQPNYPHACYIVVGGRSEQVIQYQQRAEELGVTSMVHFVGQRPMEEIPNYMALADVLLSPRNKGTNTPLKLYTYLRSGKPILATQIYSHTQILSSEIAMLVPPTVEGLAQGTVELLRNPELAQKLATNGRKVADENYSWEIFLEKNRRAYEAFIQRRPHVEIVQPVSVIETE